MNHEELAQILDDLGDGIETRFYALTWHGTATVGDYVRVTLRFFEWEPTPGGGRSIASIKEQAVAFVGPKERDVPADRAALCLRGWCEAVGRLFSALPPESLPLMPHDLVFPKALTLSRPKTADDFTAAFLVKSRLGRLMPR